MLRSVIGAIVSFVVLNVLIMAVFAVAIFGLGMERTLQPGEYWSTPTFNAIVLAGGTVMALISGMICTVIARSWTPALVVGVLMFALGTYGALKNMNKPDPGPRPAQTAEQTDVEYMVAVFSEMGETGKEPDWFAFATPIAGAVAFIVGARLVKRRRTPHGDL